MKKLWVPGEGMEFDDYKEASQEELNALWKAYSGRDTIAVPQEVLGDHRLLGSLSTPEQPIRGYASVDVCEVLRESLYSIMRLVGRGAIVHEGNPHDYKTSIGSTQAVVQEYLQVLLNNNLAQPTQGIQEIGDILRNWRDQGVYVVANTSTLASCEPGTVDFLSAHLPGAFDGIVFPRNHNGDPNLMNKGLAMQSIIRTIPPATEEGLTAIHIDDSPAHNVVFRDYLSGMEGAQFATFQPEYKTSHLGIDPGSVVSATPLESFRAADEYLAAQLGPITN